MKKSKLFALAVLIAALLYGCGAATEESAPSATEPSVEPTAAPSPSIEPAPEPTPRVLLEAGACGEYEVFAPPDSLEVCVSMSGASADGVDYTFDLDGAETPDEPRRLAHVGMELLEKAGGGETAYSLYRCDSNETTNNPDMFYSVLVSDDEQIAFIDDLLSSAEFQPVSADELISVDELSYENRLCLYAESESGFIEYQIGVDGLLIRLSEPPEFAKEEITYEAAEVGAEAAAYLHAIEWANRSFPTRCYDYWECLGDPEPADYRMCVVGEGLHLHLTADEAKEFVEAFAGRSGSDLQRRDALSTSKLGWSEYDGYIIIDEYLCGVDAPADLKSRHVVFPDGSVADRLGTRDVAVHYAGKESTTIIKFDSNFPRAANLSDAGTFDYSAALAWIASRSDE